MKHGFFLLLIPALLVALLYPEPSIAKDDKREQAAALMARAAVLMDLHSPGSPPFRLRARVRAREKDSWVEGSYEVIWKSQQQWRREISLRSFHQLRIRAEGNIWSKRTLNYLPLRVLQLLDLLTLTSRLKLSPGDTVKKIQERTQGGAKLKCVEITRKAAKKIRQELCFDPTTAALIRFRELGHRAPLKQIAEGFEQVDYAPFGSKLYPRVLRSFEGNTLVVEVLVEELTENPRIDASLFTPPKDAEISDVCENVEPARLIRRRDPPYPQSMRRSYQSGVVTFSVLIGRDGKLRSAYWVRSAGRDFDVAAFSVLPYWRYEPSLCDGRPVKSKSFIDIVFRLF